MIKIAIILGSTRPGRKGEAVAKWVLQLAQQRTDASFELVDVKAYELPVLDEPSPASTGKYTQPHTQRWSAKIAEFDAFVFVTAEYNHGIPAALKNALDFLFKEWNNKAAGFVGYGGMGATRSVEQLRQVMGTLQIADVGGQVALSTRNDWKDGVFTPGAHHEAGVSKVLDQVIAWGTALSTLRKP